jgi:hypothetical protein
MKKADRTRQPFILLYAPVAMRRVLCYVAGVVGVPFTTMSSAGP